MVEDADGPTKPNSFWSTFPLVSLRLRPLSLPLPPSLSSIGFQVSQVLRSLSASVISVFSAIFIFHFSCIFELQLLSALFQLYQKLYFFWPRSLPLYVSVAVFSCWFFQYINSAFFLLRNYLVLFHFCDES